jgi:hypothetical protein
MSRGAHADFVPRATRARRARIPNEAMLDADDISEDPRNVPLEAVEVMGDPRD